MCKSAVITGGGGEEEKDVDEVKAKRQDCRLLASTLYVLPSLATVGDREGETKKPPTKRDPVAAIAACAAADESPIDSRHCNKSAKRASTLEMAEDAAAAQPHSTSASAAAAIIAITLRLQQRSASHAATSGAGLHFNRVA